MRIQVRGQNMYVEPGRPENSLDRREMLEFQFSRDWDRYVKFAQFTQHGRTSNVMLMDGRCHVPPEVEPGRCYLNLTGMTVDSRDRASTCYVTLEVLGESLPYPGEPRDLYGELRAEMERMVRESTNMQLDPELRQSDRAAPASSVGGLAEKLKKLEEKAGQQESAGKDLEDRFQRSLDQCREREQTCRANMARSLEETREQCEQALKDLQRSQAETGADLAQLREILEELQKDTSGERIAELRESLETRIRQLSDAQNSLDSEMRSVRLGMEESGGRISEVLASLEKVQADLKEMQANAGRLAELQADMSGMEKALADARAETESIRAAISEIQAARKAFAERTGNMARDMDQRMDGFGERLSSLETQARLCESRDSHFAEEIRSIQETRAADMLDREQAKQQLKALEAQISALDGDSRAVREAVRTCETKLEDCQKRIDILNQSALALQVQNPCCPPKPERPVDRELAVLHEQISGLRQSQARLRDLVSGYVLRDQGRQNSGKILGIGEDGSVRAVDPQLASQAQADWLEVDENSARYIRNKPFKTRNGYPACDGLILYAEDRTPYLLRVNETGDLMVSAFRE